MGEKFAPLQMSCQVSISMCDSSYCEDASTLAHSPSTYQLSAIWHAGGVLQVPFFPLHFLRVLLFPDEQWIACLAQPVLAVNSGTATNEKFTPTAIPPVPCNCPVLLGRLCSSRNTLGNLIHLQKCPGTHSIDPSPKAVCRTRCWQISPRQA